MVKDNGGCRKNSHAHPKDVAASGRWDSKEREYNLVSMTPRQTAESAENNSPK
jgi:hypothetical protein